MLLDLWLESITKLSEQQDTVSSKDLELAILEGTTTSKETFMDLKIFEKKEERFKELETLIQQPGLYNNPALAAEYL